MAETNGNSHAKDSTPPTHPLPPTYSLATLALHADDVLESTTDVSPALHVSTTFRYASNPAHLVPTSDEEIPARTPHDPAPADSHIYSRETAPNSSRLELVLTSLLGAPCLTYSSGLAAFHALLIYLHPRVVAIAAGYHGIYAVLKLYQKLTNCTIIDIFAEEAKANKEDKTEQSWPSLLGKGDVVHIESPLNPTGKALNLSHYASLAHSRGALCTLDSTFAPPPLQQPFAHGVDYVMHSGTKYFGGHSDLLCGVVAVGTQRAGWERDYWGLVGERVVLGSVMGSLEGWLGVRSLRTLELRVSRQSQSAGLLVHFLQSCLLAGDGEDGGEVVKTIRRTLAKVEHASLQPAEEMLWLRKQMPNGFGPVFAVSLKTASLARRLPSKLRLFQHATSLGGVESLIEWRRMSDATVAETLCRVSVGVESWEDLRDDLVAGFTALAEEEGEEGSTKKLETRDWT